MIEDRLRLSGWSTGQSKRANRQLQLALADMQVLVTDVDYPLEFMGQLYRDRCDGENGFDELKTQWGLSGFITQ